MRSIVGVVRCYVDRLRLFTHVWKTSASASVNVNGFDEARSFKRDVHSPLGAALPPQSHKAITALCFGGDAMMHSGPVTLPVAFRASLS